MRASDRDDWHEWRRQGIGASDVPAILGLSRYASPFSVWAEKTGLIQPDRTDSDYADFGRWAERMVAPWFEERTGLHIAGEQMWLSHEAKTWMRCTVDGLVFETPEGCLLDDALGPHEIKTRNPSRRYDELPPDIDAQVAWQMLVTEKRNAWVSVLHGRRLEIYPVELDEADAAFILARVTAFWHDHVLGGVAPDLDGHDATLAALAAVYPSSVPGKTVDIDECADALRLLREAKRWVKAAATLEDSAKAVLTWAMGDGAVGLIDGDKALTIGTQTRKTTCAECGHVAESDPFRVLRPQGAWK